MAPRTPRTSSAPAAGINGSLRQPPAGSADHIRGARAGTLSTRIRDHEPNVEARQVDPRLGKRAPNRMQTIASTKPRRRVVDASIVYAELTAQRQARSAVRRRLKANLLEHRLHDKHGDGRHG